jgi:DNA invertase Pin-like site-specific DNA recombinase
MENTVAVYARISTADKGQDPEMQLRELRDYCTHRGFTIVAEYVDVGFSGSKESRPELNRLMADAGKGLFTAVVVWKFDRFARSTSHLLKALETFQNLKIDFVSLTENLDTRSPLGKFVFSILGAVGELERNLLIERVKSGMRNAALKGVKMGRPTINLDLARLAELKAAGLSQNACAKALGVDRSVLRRLAA